MRAPDPFLPLVSSKSQRLLCGPEQTDAEIECGRQIRLSVRWGFADRGNQVRLGVRPGWSGALGEAFKFRDRKSGLAEVAEPLLIFLTRRLDFLPLSLNRLGL